MSAKLRIQGLARNTSTCVGADAPVQQYTAAHEVLSQGAVLTQAVLHLKSHSVARRFQTGCMAALQAAGDRPKRLAYIDAPDALVCKQAQ
jgi:hypothetical protein